MDCFIKHFAPKIFTPFIEKLTYQTVASLSLFVPGVVPISAWGSVLASGIVGVQVQVDEGAIVASLAQILREQGASLQQNEVDQPLIRAQTQCVRIGSLA